MRNARKWVLLAAGIAAAFSFGLWQGRSRTCGDRGPRVLYWVDPMHPSYRSDKPGVAPDCGMKLEPVYDDQGSAAGAPAGAAAFGTVRVATGAQQLIGVRTAAVERAPAAGVVRTTGRVAADETRLYQMNANADVWIRRMFPPTTGSLVRKNEPLLSYYTSAFFGNATSYIFALDTLDRQRAAGMTSPEQQKIVGNQLFQAVQFLQNIGVSDAQIERLARTRKAEPLVDVVSPADGIVLQRGVSLGQYVPAGGELYKIADLRRVWVQADLFENEAQRVRPGMMVNVSVPHRQRRYAAAVSRVPPQFDADTRTLKFRLELENPGLALRPGMFVDVELPVEIEPSLVVPSEAVLDLGLRKTVFVDRGNGYFEPRRVETGASLGDRVEILRGLMSGERVVVSGNFLLDSESRMRMAAALTPGANTECVVCGMPIDEAKMRAVGRATTHRGRTYTFCSDECTKEFAANPAKHAWEAPGAPGAAPAAPAYARQEAGPLADRVLQEALARPVPEDSGGAAPSDVAHRKHRLGPGGIPLYAAPERDEKGTQGEHER
ncbi:MAG: efflux RND transporter periplasmic adaptor subunit [Deltaproteobacteria bacterium]|nr:efflux RND transporter periplasmic adaptor subunit [Deltaproteobacteria bacterium]